MNAYAHKLLTRAAGIWHALGLSLEGMDVVEHDGYTSISLNFNKITPLQAELLVSQMGKAFRRANVYWKENEQGKIVVLVEIPPRST